MGSAEQIKVMLEVMSRRSSTRSDPEFNHSPAWHPCCQEEKNGGAVSELELLLWSCSAPTHALGPFVSWQENEAKTGENGNVELAACKGFCESCSDAQPRWDIAYQYYSSA